MSTPEPIPKWLVEQFERGYAPADEPPGLEEVFYRRWKEGGGVVKHPPRRPAEPPLAVPLSRREWYAGLAMQAILARGSFSDGESDGRSRVPIIEITDVPEWYDSEFPDAIARLAWEVADAMLGSPAREVPPQ